jgi:hypothetical protein
MKMRVVAYLCLLAVLLSALVLCAFTTRGDFDAALPVNPVLPDNISGYHGFEILHCQNEDCLKSFSSEDLTNSVVCPDCGGRLDPISVAEHRLLPKDTTILHRAYRSPSGREFAVSVVIGGHERRSIHKPQVCIVGQGNVISGQHLIKVTLDGTANLDVMLMDVNRSHTYFAYWFTDGRLETARHLTRLARTAWDGIIHNQRRRWAYISVSVRNTGGRDALPELKNFIGQLHPMISL